MKKHKVSLTFYEGRKWEKDELTFDTPEESEILIYRDKGIFMLDANKIIKQQNEEE